MTSEVEERGVTQMPVLVSYIHAEVGPSGVLLQKIPNCLSCQRLFHRRTDEEQSQKRADKGKKEDAPVNHFAVSRRGEARPLIMEQEDKR